MHRVLASWFGSGLILRRLRGSDLGSGTIAALVTAPVAIALNHYVGWVAVAGAAALVTVLSVRSASRFAATEGDAGWMVADEAAGTFLALVGLGIWPGAVVSFLVFRAADIFKGVFPGVAWADSLPGGWGVTADDLVAGHIAQGLL